MLSNILQIQDLRTLFPDVRERSFLQKKDLYIIQQNYNDKLHALGLHQWDRICEWGPAKVEKFAIAEYARTGKPGIIAAIDDLISAPLVIDIIYHHFTVERNGRDMTVAEIMIAHLYPNELHLSDVEFSNPDKPLPPNKQRRYQEFEGLGLLKPTIQGLLQTARDLNCRALTLTAADLGLMKLFTTLGFSISDTFIGRRCKANSNITEGFPMEIRL
ncbi:hypothetical protein GO495_27330 [Chitinophaga oryziterrae]|uniref:Uncharacterized protein n=1 Tax=Chitinophaga oryziterrae TaxID=1031224 RepID=A0A6N8JGI0_9BACT|nr:hypothetical protein [Chitinophaga oryziterrae]MVT44337.1 hypothetical protein [Chitinophaga oryziterrae]